MPLLITFFSVSTITQMTIRRFIQLVHIEPTTVAHANTIRPSAAVTTPIVTYMSSDSPLCLAWICTFHPSRGMSSTVPSRRAFSCDSRSCLAFKAVPAFAEIVVTLGSICSYFHGSVTSVQCLIIFAFYEISNTIIDDTNDNFRSYMYVLSHD